MARPGVDLVGSEGVDDGGEGDLHGFACVGGADVEDVMPGSAEMLRAVRNVGGVEAVVEVAELPSAQLDRLALNSVGLDVSANCHM